MWSVIGQNRAVTLLQRSLEKGSLAHAYLFVGPAHVGKMTLALNLAQAVNCASAEPPCGHCLPCQKVASARHADVQTINLSHHDLEETENRVKISVDQIEELQHSASLPPFEGRCKVFIIEGAEFLSIGAANRLLKTLEEPVAKVLFILLATSERLLPATVVSRCQRLELLPAAVAEVEAALKANWDVAPEKARLLARLSHGCLGWAVRALEEPWLEQRAQWLDELLGIPGADGEERFALAARLAAQFGRDRTLVQERLNLWRDWWRDLLLIKAGCGGNITNIDQLATLIDLASGYHLAQIRKFINSIGAAAEQLDKNANPQLVLEVLMLNVPEANQPATRAAATGFEVNYG